MPIAVVVSLALQIFCIVHVVRSGRSPLWIFALLIGSYLAVAAYVLIAIAPDLFASPGSRIAAGRVLSAVDPERRRRKIETALEAADTVDNRRYLAEESLRLGDCANAAELYRSVLKGLYATDPDFMLGLAHAEAGLGHWQVARETLERLIAENPDYRSPDGHLLYARSLDELGDRERALAEYEVLARSYPGEEARLRYARLLRASGRDRDARGVLEEMLRRAKASPRYYRRKEREWLDDARRELQAIDA